MNKQARMALLGVLTFGIGTISAVPAFAQDDGVEVGIGYQFVRFGGFELNYPLGLNVDVAFPLTTMPLSIVGEFGWSRHSDSDVDFTSNLVNVGGGVRWMPELEAEVMPFVQVLLGIQRDSDKLGDIDVFSESTFMLQPGGGVSFPLNDSWDLFGQFDIRRVFYEDEGETGIRFVLGGRTRF